MHEAHCIQSHAHRFRPRFKTGEVCVFHAMGETRAAASVTTACRKTASERAHEWKTKCTRLKNNLCNMPAHSWENIAPVAWMM